MASESCGSPSRGVGHRVRGRACAPPLHCVHENHAPRGWGWRLAAAPACGCDGARTQYTVPPVQSTVHSARDDGRQRARAPTRARPARPFTCILDARAPSASAALARVCAAAGAAGCRYRAERALRSALRRTRKVETHAARVWQCEATDCARRRRESRSSILDHFLLF